MTGNDAAECGRGTRPGPGDLADLCAQDGRAAVCRMTLSPTMADGVAEAQRRPRRSARSSSTRGWSPGVTPARLSPRDRARAFSGTGDYELESPRGPTAGTRSPIQTRRSGTRSRRGSRAAESGGTAWCRCSVAGFTDSHWFREAFGTVAYGFFPARTMDAEIANRLVHSAERRRRSRPSSSRAEARDARAAAVAAGTPDRAGNGRRAMRRSAGWAGEWSRSRRPPRTTGSPPSRRTRRAVGLRPRDPLWREKP